MKQDRVHLTFTVGLPSAAHQLSLPATDFRLLFQRLGPSLGLWRAAEIAALREHYFEPPVLDLGCGDGLVTAQVLDRVAIGLDPDPHALARAVAQGIYVELQPVAAEKCTLPAGSIGTILSNSVLEHLPNLDAVLLAAARLLRPDGKLIFTVPSDAFPNWLAVPNRRYSAWRNRQLVHLNLWPMERWAEHLGRAGFQVETVRPYLRRPLVAAWDALELMQQVSVGQRRIFGLVWRRLPPSAVNRLARRAANLDLSAPFPGGGRLVVALKR